MASYHLAVKTVSRSAGRTATAAAAYRAGVEIADERTGLVHDYTRKTGIEPGEIVLPADAPAWAADRSALWNAAERSERRKNSVVAREFEIALPAELSADDRRALAVSFAREISERHGVAVDVSIHAPGREGDNRNHHAHLMLTTRRLGPEGLGEKTRELDEQKLGEVERWRARWSDMQNQALERADRGERVDHRSLKRQGLDIEPQVKMGPAIMAIERKAQRSAERQGRGYAPVTQVGRHNAALAEKRRLQIYIEKGAEWLRQQGTRVQNKARAIMSVVGLTARDQRQDEREAARNLREGLERLRIEQERQRQRDIEKQRERTKDRDGPSR